MSQEGLRASPAPLAPEPVARSLAPVPEAPRQDRLLVEGVSRSFRGHQVLTDVDLRVRPGEWISISGSNGAGKTTLLRILAGVITPEGGRVTVDGLDPARDRRAYQRRIGFLSAGDRGLYARLTVRQNLEFWGRLAMVEPQRLVATIDAAIARFALEELAERRMDRLSMGQRQRTRLAMTFLHEPLLLLLDEPRTSLDTDATALLRAAIEEALARSASVLWIAPAGDPELDGLDRFFVVEGGTLRPA